jgi:purine nucleosidase
LPDAGLRHACVIDTDCANEIDDQFALAWALLAPERLNVLGLYAAPFSFAHRRAGLGFAPRDERPFAPPAVGMERSFEEIQRVVALAGTAKAAAGCVQRGATRYLTRPTDAVASDATAHLIEQARAHHRDGAPLYVLVLGCPVNVASALRLAPDIAERIVVVWTAGHASQAPQANAAFNLEQDVHASRVLLDSRVPLVYLPGYHVGAQLRLSLPEMERWVQGQGALGTYLHQLYTHNPLWEMLGVNSFFAHTWVIWDLICVAWLLQPAWVPTSCVTTPFLDADLRWRNDPPRHPMRQAHGVDRDAIFADFFSRLAGAAPGSTPPPAR